MSRGLPLAAGVGRLAIVLLAALAPRAVRARWIEEWHAEIDHAATRLQSRRAAACRLLWFAAGAFPDVLVLRGLPRPRVPARSDKRLAGIGQDLRHAVRTLAQSPAFTATVVGSLALGLAANTAAFVFLQSAVFPGFPGTSDPDRLVRLRLERRCSGDVRCAIASTFGDLAVWRDSIPGLSGIAASSPSTFAVGARNQPISVAGAFVSANYFAVLGVAIPIGRPFTADEESSATAGVAVIGHGLWQRLFGGDPAVLGEDISVGGQSVRVVGIAAPEFGGPARLGSPGAELWVPWGLGETLGLARGQSAGGLVVMPPFEVIGRIDRSSSLDAVNAQAAIAAARIGASRADNAHGAVTAIVRPVGAKNLSGLVFDIAGVLILPVIVLGIACINAANLLLVRGQQRARDIAVRLAIGASRWRIVREVLVECGMLAALAAIGAVVLTAWSIRAIEAHVPIPLRLETPAVVLTMLTALMSVLVFGVVPAYRSASVAPMSAIGSRSSGTTLRPRGRQILVAAQVALAVGLLGMGSQMLTAVSALARITGADDPSRLLIVSFDLSQFQMAPASSTAFYDRVADRVRGLPGVARVGVARPSAVWNLGNTVFSAVNVWPAGAGAEGRAHRGGYAGGDLFGAIGLSLLQGRGFDPSDRTTPPRVAIVTRAAAERWFEGTAVGRVIRVSAGARSYDAGHDVEIVGVVESPLDPNYVRTADAGSTAVYLPASLEPEPVLALYVRATDDPAPLVAAIRAQVDAVDPRVPFLWTATLADRRYARQTEELLAVQGLAALGVMALALATGGLYGLVSFIVSTRRREVGVRIALGAAPRGIMKMLLLAGARMAIVGTAFGGGIALALSAVLRASMYGIPPLDPVALALLMVLLAAAVLAASLLPARRAACLDPLVVLKEE